MHNSNDKVGENMVRLIEDHEKKPGYALSGRSIDDFGSVDRVFDQLQTKGIFKA